MEAFRDTQLWFVVFSDTRNKRWWDLFTRRGFRHVRLVRDIDNGFVLVVDCLAHIMATKAYAVHIEEALNQLGQNATAVLSYEVAYGAHYKTMPIEPFTCVALVKRMLGIRSRFVLTPYRLYRELLTAGATVIKPWTPHIREVL